MQLHVPLGLQIKKKKNQAHKWQSALFSVDKSKNATYNHVLWHSDFKWLLLQRKKTEVGFPPPKEIYIFHQ